MDFSEYNKTNRIDYLKGRGMCADFFVSILDDYVYAVVTGDYNLEESKQHIERIFEACLNNQKSDVLLDTRQANVRQEMDMLSRFDFITFIVQKRQEYLAKGLLRFRIALLGSPAQVNQDGFAELVGGNRGLVMIVTADLETAKDWLMGRNGDVSSGAL